MAERTPGAVIRAARERKQMTQAQLAKRLGVAERTVRMWETSSTVPRARRFALAAELGLSDSFTSPDAWGREADLSERDDSKRFVPPELRSGSRYRGRLVGAGRVSGRLDAHALEDAAAWSEIASWLFGFRVELDELITYVMQRAELERRLAERPPEEPGP